MAVLDVQVGAGADDGRRVTGTAGFSATTSGFQIGYNTNVALLAMHVFFRWTGATFSGTVDVSYVSIHSYAQGGTAQLKVYGVDEDNPPAPTDAGEFDADPLTTAALDWNGAWADEDWNNSPSLNTIFQELVDSYTISGDAVMVQVKNDGPVTDNWNGARSHETDTTLAAKLHIEYTAGGAVTVTPGVLAMTTTAYASPMGFGFIPSVLALTTTAYAPPVGLGVIPSVASLTTAAYAPPIGLGVVPSAASLTTTTFVPPIGTGVVPSTASLTTTGLAPAVGLGVVPATASLIMSFFIPVIDLAVTIAGVIPPFGRSKMTRRIGLGRLKR